MNRRQYLTKILDGRSHNRFINFYCDFETVIHEGRHNVSCYSIVGKNYQSSNIIKITNNEDILEASKNLILEFLNKCFELVNASKNRSKPHLFFFHNLNKFDSYFILNVLSDLDLFDIQLISRNNQVYKIVVSDKKTNVKFEFRDSLLYLPISLDTLSSIFCTNYKKTIFNQESNILESYIINDNFRSELIEYCLNDSKALQEGFEVFLEYIRNTLSIEPLMCLSLPGISLRYFRTKFYNDLKMPIERLSENKDNFIRKSYRGGSVEVFRPHLQNGFHYDVNSLYPYIMKSFPMPIEIGKWKDIDNIEDFFGFVKVEVESPAHLHKPFLNYYDEKLGLIAPVGTWVEIYFSEEIKYALTLGYKFKYLKGLSYEKGILFNDFVDTLYNIRSQYPKGSPLNIITKLIMNSLYGRFGMKVNMPKSKIIDNDEIQKYVSSYDVANISCFDKKSLINFTEIPILDKLNKLLEHNYIDVEKYNSLQKQKISINESSAVQIASAITAYSRIHMHKLLSTSNIAVYYTDTDSIFCNKPFPDNSVSQTELGKLKLENEIKEGIFLLPKLYMIKTANGHTIIKSKGIDSKLLSEKDIYNIFDNSTSFIKKFVSHFKRNFQKFTISQRSSTIQISPNLLKRTKIIKNGKWVDTNPLKI